MKLTIILGLFLSLRTNAKICNLESGLTKKQLKSIKKAKKIKRKGLTQYFLVNMFIV